MRKNRFILAAILLLGIGFAAVSTTLYLTGNVTIATNDADFDVKFTKAVIDGTDTPSAIIEDGKKITFGTKDLVTVGDKSVLDFEVTNNSEMYDAEVSIDCTAAGEKSNYYEITKEVATPIVAKTIGTGKVEVKLLKATVEDIHEDFTCTLTATAKERTSKAEKPKYIPTYFEYGNPTASSPTDYTAVTYPEKCTGGQAKVFAGLDANESQKSICILRNGSLECFKNNNLEEEKSHMTEVFGENNCSFYNSSFTCTATFDFACTIYDDGGVLCYDPGGFENCWLQSDDTVICDSHP